MAGRQGPPRGWLSGFGRLDWRGDERGFASLLDALTRDRLELEAVERELSATPRQNLADVQKDQDKVERDELAEARRELDDFRAALADAHARGRDERAEVPYDGGVPTQNRAADVLIQYVVRPGYAEVRTEEPRPEQYVYYIRVDWQKLRALARAQGHPITL
jgi:hypothetical protein